MDESDDGRAGFKRPPVSGQFKKGQSGNPSGRPRKAKPVAPIYHPAAEPTRSIWREEALRTISLREGDKTVEMSLTQAVIRSTGLAAAKGRPMAQRTFLTYALAEDARYRAERRESFDYWYDYKRDKLELIEKCRARGVELPDLLPHPEDIEFDHLALEVKFKGALDTEERAEQDRTIAVRDYALALSFYYGERHAMAESKERTIGIMLLFFVRFQLALPKRLHVPDAEFDRRFFHWFKLTRKEFEAELSALAHLAQAPFTPSSPQKRPCRVIAVASLGLRNLRDLPEPIPTRRSRRRRG